MGTKEKNALLFFFFFAQCPEKMCGALFGSHSVLIVHTAEILTDSAAPEVLNPDLPRAAFTV